MAQAMGTRAGRQCVADVPNTFQKASQYDTETHADIEEIFNARTWPLIP
jgi:hypothetical protein